jgi:DNA (cytosine-5)-methyltransferase 1
MSPDNLFRRACEIFSQEQIAAHIDRDIRTVRRWESGKTPVPKIAEASLRELLNGIAFPGVKEPAARYGRESKFRFIDLFAGIGGTRLGFEDAGGECVFTSEWDKYACQTYRANHVDTHEIRGDITAINADEIPDHDVLVGGFPCQPFSLAGVSKKNSLGRSHGFLDKTQGTLFFDVARIIKAKRPQAFLLENVKNLRSHDRGRTFEIILRTLRDELGYTVFPLVIDARSMVPQHRERIFIVGFRDGQYFNWKGVDLKDGIEGPKLESILHAKHEEPELPFTERKRKNTTVSEKYTLSDHLWNYLQAYAAKHLAKGNGFGCSVFGPEGVARTLSARYHKDGSEILIRQEGKNPRRLTPRECARLMGFPDSFKIPVSDTQAYRQFGNSVVVPVVREIAKGIATILRGDEMETIPAGVQLDIPGMVAEDVLEVEPVLQP